MPLSHNPVLAPSDGQRTDNGTFIVFQFTYNEIKHKLDLDGIIDDPTNWLPTGTSNFITQLPPGHWKISTHGRNNKDGCTGEGDGIVFTATTDPTS